MGIQSIGGSGTIAPYKSQKPRITFANSYANGAQTWNTFGNIADMTYDVSNNSLVYTRGEPSGSSTTSFDRFSLTNNTFSTGTFPVNASASARIQGTHNGGLVFFPRQDVATGTSYGIYYSTNSGSTWTGSLRTDVNYNDIMPAPATLRTVTNNSDVIPFFFKQGNNWMYYNSTASSVYGTVMSFPSNWGNGANNNAVRHLVIPISRGADDFNIEGYYVLNGQGFESQTGDGSKGILSFAGEDKRGTWYGRIVTNNDGYTSSGTGYLPYRFVPVSASLRGSCIENRWFIFTMSSSGSAGGLFIYDLENEKFTSGPFGFGDLSFGSKPVYISATKKLYIFQSKNQTMYEFDVTFE